VVCVRCGKVREFSDPELVRRQNAIADELGFRLTDRTLYLYGLCKDGCDKR
jgi:Fur family ferric uptake transcriptional regulator